MLWFNPPKKGWNHDQKKNSPIRPGKSHKYIDRNRHILPPEKERRIPMMRRSACLPTASLTP